MSDRQSRAIDAARFETGARGSRLDFEDELEIEGTEIPTVYRRQFTERRRYRSPDLHRSVAESGGRRRIGPYQPHPETEDRERELKHPS